MVRPRRLGRTGLAVSEIGFGGAPAGLTNYLGNWDAASDEAAEQIVRTVRRAADLGVTYFDTVPGYGQGISESMLGRAIQGRRAGLTIATKVTGDSADAVRRSIEGSLTRLGIERLDVLQHHGGWYIDEQVHHILKPGGALSGMSAQVLSDVVPQNDMRALQELASRRIVAPRSGPVVGWHGVPPVPSLVGFAAT